MPQTTTPDLQTIVDALETVLDFLLANQDRSAQSSPDVQTVFKRATEIAGMPEFEPPSEVLRVRQMLGRESDRGCALAAASYLETELERLFRGYLVGNSPALTRLFTGNGALATFASRVDLALALGLISPAVGRDLHLIRKVRNEFAHTPDALTFEDPAIASRCNALVHDIFHESLSPRRRFLRVVLGVTASIHAAMRLPRCVPKRDLDLNDPHTRDAAIRLREAITQALKEQSDSGGSGA